MGKSTISLAIFHCYVSSPEGSDEFQQVLLSPWCFKGAFWAAPLSQRAASTGTKALSFGPWPSHCVLIPHNSLHFGAFLNQGSTWWSLTSDIHKSTNRKLHLFDPTALILCPAWPQHKPMDGFSKTWVNLKKNNPGTRPKRMRDGPLSNANLCPKTSCQTMIG